MSDPTALDLLTQARLVRDGALSARALTEAHLQRIAALDGSLGAFLAVDAPAALAEASAIDEARSAGRPLGPLAGVPVAIKDQIVTRHLETTAGSKILRGWSPPYDATVVARLREAGAVILGKTNLDEFAMGSANVSSAFHVTRNPWSLAHVPGGSSGGSAAAVAAHLAASALGTDTGGSVRQPASFCGIVGLKPTYGRVSRYGAIAYASSLDQVGTFGRTIADVAAIHQVIAGHDPRDQTSLPDPVRPPALDADRDLEGLRIGLPAEYLATDGGIDPSVRVRVDSALAALEARGARLVPVSLPHTRYAIATYYLIATAEASSNLARYDGIRYGHRTEHAHDLAEMYARTRAEGFGAEVKRRIMLGTFALSSGYYDAYYGQAQRARTLIARDFHEAFREVDLIAGPTSPVPAWRLNDKLDDPIAMYLMDIFTVPASLAGMPGLSVPIGLTGLTESTGLPVGLQLIGPPLAEPRLLEVGAVLEALFPPLACPFGGAQ
jgi:aspartyl-tRNA(Asn)/glutamyl-tRNA(Gln) amidotransferase subunit A